MTQKKRISLQASSFSYQFRFDALTNLWHYQETLKIGHRIEMTQKKQISLEEAEVSRVQLGSLPLRTSCTFHKQQKQEQ